MTNTIIYAILIIIAIIILWLISVYNGLIRRRYRVREAWADIEVQLKRRWDLIPNLVNAVKGYATHEQSTFDRITEARAKSIAGGGHDAGAENILTQALKSVFAVAENYPDLKANQNFLELQRDLTDTENKIQAARRFYNTNVRDYNTAIDSFPTNLVAKSFGFKGDKLFDIPDEMGQTPEVKF